MKLRVLVVGRIVSELAVYESRFIKRMVGACELQIIELPEGRSKQLEQRKQEEEKHILKAVNADFILMDEHGKQLQSTQWASHLSSLQGNAVQDFVIGGAAGVSDVIKAKASQTWGLSKLTLPHQMARVMVAEQLYRAWSIMQGHPYHRE